MSDKTFLMPLVPALLGAGLFAQSATIGDHRIGAEMQPPAPVNNLNFGSSVDVSGDLALIGIAGDSTAGLAEGAVSVRSRNLGGPGAWGELQLLLPPNPALNGGLFGDSVALSGPLAVVSSRQSDTFTFDGEVHLMNAVTGATIATLQDPSNLINFFGQDVDTDGTTVIVGMDYLDPGPPAQQFQGRAYLYDAAGNFQFALDPSDAMLNWFSGTAVAVDGPYALVGAYGADTQRGAVYVFDTATGAELFKLTASDGATGDQFGYSVAIEGSLAVIGAPRKGAFNIGGAYLFDLTTGTELHKFDDESSVSSGGNFGWSVAIADDRVYISAPGSFGWVGPTQYSGRVYAFDLDYRYAVHWFDNPDDLDWAPSGVGWDLAADGGTLFDSNRAAVGTAPGQLIGRAYVSERQDLGLGTNKFSTFAGDVITFTNRGGAIGGWVGTAVVGVNGAPVGPIVIPGSAGLLDGLGEQVFQFTMPPGLGGTTLTVQCAALSKSGGVAFSNTRDLKVN